MSIKVHFNVNINYCIADHFSGWNEKGSGWEMEVAAWQEIQRRHKHKKKKRIGKEEKQRAVYHSI